MISSVRYKCFFLLLLICNISLSIDARTIIHAGKLIDGKSDRIQSKICIVIDGNLIKDVKEGYVSQTE